LTPSHQIAERADLQLHGHAVAGPLPGVAVTHSQTSQCRTANSAPPYHAACLAAPALACSLLADVLCFHDADAPLLILSQCDAFFK